MMMQPVEFATQYHQIRSVNMLSTIRDILIPPVAWLDAVTGQMAQALQKNRIQFLYLHHVLEDEEDDFRELLAVLSQQHRFISYSEAVERIWTGEIDAPYITFSFDDGMQSCDQSRR